ncbi:hypothetical protein, partial [Pseudomonas sp. NBRC 111133]|uniref:hypothetical protein n=1 Tax=Pseudomonas sp. NBRC 111133 TaxID=1661048 RepID=UPI001C437E25
HFLGNNAAQKTDTPSSPGKSGHMLSTLKTPMNPAGTLANALYITEALTQHTRHAYDCSGSYAQIERVFYAWSLCVRPFTTPAIGISTQLALPSNKAKAQT